MHPNPMSRESLVVGIGLAAVLLVVLDALNVIDLPLWFLVLGMPVAGAVIWRGGGASVVAVASWVAPLAALLYLGYAVLAPPLDALVIGATYLWFVAMILSPRVAGAWCRGLRLR